MGHCATKLGRCINLGTLAAGFGPILRGQGKDENVFGFSLGRFGPPLDRDLAGAKGAPGVGVRLYNLGVGRRRNESSEEKTRMPRRSSRM